MKKPVHWTLVLAGYFLIVLGVAGLLLPIMPGWPFIILGAILLGEESKIGKWIDRHMPKKIRDLMYKKK